MMSSSSKNACCIPGSEIHIHSLYAFVTRAFFRQQLTLYKLKVTEW